MPKIGFKRLAKGVALLTSHIHSQIALGLSRLTGTGVAQDNLERGHGTFRLNLSIPSIPGRDGAGNATTGKMAVPLRYPLFRSTGQVLAVLGRQPLKWC